MIMIQAERLVLRPFEETDFEEVYRIYQDEDTCRYLLHEPWNHQNARSKFLKKLNNRDLATGLAINLAVVWNEAVIGDVCAWFTDMKETVEIGYSFDHRANGNGFATEACRAFVVWLFSQNNIHRIQANLDARNIPSAKVCERIGMRKEAHFLQDFWSKGEWTDSFVYGMLRSDLNL